MNSEPDARRLCLVGLPATGKTTFIAALWTFLTSATPGGDFRVSTYPNDPKYLNAIANAWATASQMPRNSLGSADRIQFSLQSSNGETLTLVLPDLPGEAFRDAVVRPFIGVDTAAAVVESDLLLFFVNGETAKTYAALGDFTQDPPDSNSKAKPTEFVVEDLDSDTLNTELLHRLLYLRRDVARTAILILISAWDVHAHSGDSPAEWLRREQPMLSQYVEEVGRKFTVGVMGVSAQGANYADSPAIVELDAEERAWSADGSPGRLPLSAPLRWLYGVADQP